MPNSWPRTAEPRRRAGARGFVPLGRTRQACRLARRIVNVTDIPRHPATQRSGTGMAVRVLLDGMKLLERRGNRGCGNARGSSVLRGVRLG